MTPPRESTLEIVARYWLPHEALVAKSALEAFGVPAWVLDETQIRMRWYLANTLGGVKLAVRAEDAYTAREILSGDHAADLSSIEEAALPPHPSEVCERCGLPLVADPRRGVGTLHFEWACTTLREGSRLTLRRLWPRFGQETETGPGSLSFRGP